MSARIGYQAREYVLAPLSARIGYQAREYVLAPLSAHPSAIAAGDRVGGEGGDEDEWQEWSFGAKYGFPEKACCACGRPATLVLSW